MALPTINVRQLFNQATSESQKVPIPQRSKYVVERTKQLITNTLATFPDYIRDNTLGNFNKILLQALKEADSVSPPQRLNFIVNRLQNLLDYLIKTANKPKKHGIVGGVIGAAKGIKKGVMFGVKLIGNAPFLPLLPFVPAMKREIKAKGLTPKKNLGALALQFHKEVMRKKHYDFYDHQEKDNIVGFAAATLVPIIIKFFKQLKDKKAAGIPLTTNEQKLLDTVEQGEQAVLDEAKDQGANTIGSFIIEHKTPIILGALGTVSLILILMGRRSK